MATKALKQRWNSSSIRLSFIYRPNWHYTDRYCCRGIWWATLARELASLLENLPIIGRYAATVSFVLVVGSITFSQSSLANSYQNVRSARSRTHRRVGRSADVFSLACGRSVVQLLADNRRHHPANRRERQCGRGSFRGRDTHYGAKKAPPPASSSLKSAKWSKAFSLWRFAGGPFDDAAHRHHLVGRQRERNRDSFHCRTFCSPVFPVCDGALDKVLGIVRAKDLLARTWSGQPFDLRASLQQPLYLPETMPALRARWNAVRPPVLIWGCSWTNLAGSKASLR